MSTDGPISAPPPSGLDRKSTLIVFLLTSVLSGAGMTVVIHVIRPSAAALPTALAGTFVGLVCGVWMTRFVVVSWQRNGGAAMAKALQLAIRNKRLPPRADPQVWRPLLATRRTAALRGRWMYPILLLGLAALYLAAALTHAFPALGDLIWWGVVFFGGVGIYAPFETAKQLRGIEALKEQLDQDEREGIR